MRSFINILTLLIAIVLSVATSFAGNIDADSTQSVSTHKLIEQTWIEYKMYLPGSPAKSGTNIRPYLSVLPLPTRHCVPMHTKIKFDHVNDYARKLVPGVY
jgi:hypothetical protein